MRGLIALSLCVLAFAGCLESETDPDALDTEPMANEYVRISHQFDSEFLLAGLDGAQFFTFEVPNGTEEVEGLLMWTMPGAALDFRLMDPDGKEAANGWGESDSHRYVTTTLPPKPGTWKAEVTAQQGADVHFSLAVETRKAEPFGAIERTYTVMPDDFAEINYNMAPGDHFTFDWESDGEVYFNVHFHKDGATERPMEYTGTALDGNFTAPITQVYSVLWRNTGVLPVEVTVSTDGVYRLHSMTRDVSEA